MYKAQAMQHIKAGRNQKKEIRKTKKRTYIHTFYSLKTSNFTLFMTVLVYLYRETKLNSNENILYENLIDQIRFIIARYVLTVFSLFFYFYFSALKPCIQAIF